MKKPWDSKVECFEKLNLHTTDAKLTNPFFHLSCFCCFWYKRKLVHTVMSSFLSLTHDSMQGSQSSETRQQISLCPLLLKNSAQLGPTFSASSHYTKTIVIKYKVEMSLIITHHPLSHTYIQAGGRHLCPLWQWSGYFYHPPAHIILSWVPPPAGILAENHLLLKLCLACPNYGSHQPK